MEPVNKHPLDHITHQSNLTLLECCIPFVDYPLKLPLALFIKFNEIRLIMNAFQSPDTLSSYGLHEKSNSLSDLLAAFTGTSPKLIENIIQILNTMPNNLDTSDFNAGGFDASTPFSSNMDFTTLLNLFGGKNDTSNNFSNTTNHFNERIYDIFSEYDLQQAYNYDSNSDFISNSVSDSVSESVSGSNPDSISDSIS